MIVRGVLRATAIAIALAAVLDPAIVRERPTRERVTVVAMDDRSITAADQVRDRLADVSNVTTWLHQERSAAAACPSDGECIIVSSGAAPHSVSAGARVAGIMRVEEQQGGRVLTDIDAPDTIHRDTAATLRVTTARPVQRVEVFDGDVLVGSAEPTNQTSVDVPWIPLAEGARVLRIVADEDTAHVGVRVDAKPGAVLFYEPQVTWLGTFVRRALEDDTRFTLGGRTRVAPPIAVTRGRAAALSVASLEESSVVVVTAPELLSTAEVDLLERFVTTRGGSLIVLSDRRPSGASLRLLPRIVGEHRTPRPLAAGMLRASEWMTFAAPTGTATLAALDDMPVIVSRAVGRGRIIVSGALDAWRYRDVTDRFDEFWTGLTWEASLLAGARLRLWTDRTIAIPGEQVAVHVEQQSMADSAGSAESVAASGRLECGGERQVLRLWPGARAGSFTATFRGDTQGDCTIRVAVGDAEASTPVTIRDDLQRLSRHDPRLEAIAAAHEAVFVTAAREDELVARVRAQLTSRRERTPDWPMRSPSWIVPFVLCLGVEWWLRRRNGLS